MSRAGSTVRSNRFSRATDRVVVVVTSDDGTPLLERAGQGMTSLEVPPSVLSGIDRIRWTVRRSSASGAVEASAPGVVELAR